MVGAGMRLSVYAVDAKTGERRQLRPETVVSGDSPLLSQTYPPCECPRCRRLVVDRRAS